MPGINAISLYLIAGVFLALFLILLALTAKPSNTPASKSLESSTTGSVSYTLKVIKNDGPCNCSGSTVYPLGRSAYSYGATVNISAVPGQDYRFVRWTCSGTGCYNGTNETADIMMRGNITEMAIFYTNFTQVGGAGGGIGGASGTGGGTGGTAGYGGGES